jgi:hypothetical protein
MQLLAEQLVAAARSSGLELTGADGLLTGLTKQVLETALQVEMAEHLGYDRHDPLGRLSGNSRNGFTPKTVRTDIGEVTLAAPRDRAGTFEPAVVPKHQRRLAGFDQAVLSLYAMGMTTGDIAARLAEVYDTEVSRELVSKVTDAVIAEMNAWQSRPLDPVYRVILIDAIVLKVREGTVANRPVYVAMGITIDGHRDILGLWVGPSGGEGARQWMNMLTELRTVAFSTRASCAATASRGSRTPSWRPGRRPRCRPAWCTWCATRCGTPPRPTGHRSPPGSRACTWPRRGCSRGRVRGLRRAGGAQVPGHDRHVAPVMERVRAVPGLPTRCPQADLHHQRHRVPHCPLPSRDPASRAFPQRAVSAHDPLPDRAGTTAEQGPTRLGRSTAGSPS